MNKMNTKKLVALALLAAIVAVVQVLGGAVKIGPVSVTLVLIPILVGAAVYGARAGAFLGAVFGAIVLVNCINGTDVGGNMLWNANPPLTAALCLVKGALAGAASGLVYRMLSKKSAGIGAVLAAAVGPVVNTGLFCLALFFCYHETLLLWANGTPALEYILVSLVGVNFLMELVVNLIISPVIPRIVRIVDRR